MSAVNSLSIPEKTRWKLAKEEANKLSVIYSTPPVPVLEIAESLGLRVIFTNFGTVSERVSGFCDFREKTLYINSTEPFSRQTFTIAHELGHWVLHHELFAQHPEKYQVLPRCADALFYSPLEQEANCFAATLLAPTHLLKPVRNAPVTRLADVFGVSRTMMEHRLKSV